MINNAFAYINYAIVADQQNRNIRDLQERRIQHKARRTRSLRQIQGIGDGAFTIAELRDKVAERRQQEAEKEAHQQIQDQES